MYLLLASRFAVGTEIPTRPQIERFYLLGSCFSPCFLANQTRNESIYNLKGGECDDWFSIFLSFLMFYLIGLILKLGWAMSENVMTRVYPNYVQTYLKWIVLPTLFPKTSLSHACIYIHGIYLPIGIIKCILKFYQIYI